MFKWCKCKQMFIGMALGIGVGCGHRCWVLASVFGVGIGFGGFGIDIGMLALILAVENYIGFILPNLMSAGIVPECS
jgi:hypothetical protein